MADKTVSSTNNLSETMKDMGNGTFARVVAAASVNADGSSQTALPPGRAAASASVPVVLSTEDLAALRRDQVQTPVATAAAAAAQVAKAAPGVLYGLNVVSGASAGYVMIFNLAAKPADGTVTPSKCYALAANSSLQMGWDKGLSFSVGIVIVFSTTGPYTKTESATAFIESEVI